MKKVLAESMMSYLSGQIAYHKANVAVYLTSPVGIGEHPDIMAALEEELAKVAEYQEKYDVLGQLLMDKDING